MAQTTNFNSNNTENGWIYNFLNEKIAKIEKDMVEVMNLVEKAVYDSQVDLSGISEALLNSKVDIKDIESIVVNQRKNEDLPYEVNIKTKEGVYTIPISFNFID